MRWIIEEIEYLKNNYGDLSIGELKNNLNRSEKSIRKKAVRLNISKNHLWTNKEIDYLKNNYRYRNKDELIKKLDHSWKGIKNKASNLNLTGISIDEDFFKKWTKEMAWTFGIWIADGNMHEKNNAINFTSNDYDLLGIIKSNLKSDHKIGKNRNCFQFRFSNKILYNDLLKRGGTPIKSLTIQFPEVPDKFLPDFIRGYLDGDGSNNIHIYRRGINNNRYLRSVFTGNIDFLTVLKDKIEEHANIHVNKLHSNKNCNPRIKQLSYHNKKAIALCDYIYQDSENSRLERKFEIYDQMKKECIKNWS